MKSRTIAGAYGALCQKHPAFRKWTRRFMYQFMARHARQREWTFMNYGYAPLDDQTAMPELHAADEYNRYPIQLYHHVVRAVKLLGADVLEVGSGRGGGAAYLRRYHRPQKMVGVDFSDHAVSFSREHHRDEGLHFVAGDAENLPFGDNSFDAVVNVESSHCYGSMEGFLAQVRRVLRPGGAFLFADFRDREHLERLDRQLDRSGLKVAEQADITPHALLALDLDHERRLGLVRKAAPPWLLTLGQEFAGVKGSGIYDRFRLRTTVYQSFVLTKP